MKVIPDPAPVPLRGRGRPPSSPIPGILAGLRVGHSVVVRDGRLPLQVLYSRIRAAITFFCQSHPRRRFRTELTEGAGVRIKRVRVPKDSA